MRYSSVFYSLWHKYYSLEKNNLKLLHNENIIEGKLQYYIGGASMEQCVSCITNDNLNGIDKKKIKGIVEIKQYMYTVY